MMFQLNGFCMNLCMHNSIVRLLWDIDLITMWKPVLYVRYAKWHQMNVHYSSICMSMKKKIAAWSVHWPLQLNETYIKTLILYVLDRCFVTLGGFLFILYRKSTRAHHYHHLCSIYILCSKSYFPCFFSIKRFNGLWNKYYHLWKSLSICFCLVIQVNIHNICIYIREQFCCLPVVYSVFKCVYHLRSFSNQLILCCDCVSSASMLKNNIDAQFTQL